MHFPVPRQTVSQHRSLNAGPPCEAIEHHPASRENARSHPLFLAPTIPKSAVDYNAYGISQILVSSESPVDRRTSWHTWTRRGSAL